MMTSPDGKSRTADLTELKAALAAGDRGRLAGLLETMSGSPLENLKGADLATLGAASLFTGNVERAEPWLARAVAARPDDLSVSVYFILCGEESDTMQFTCPLLCSFLVNRRRQTNTIITTRRQSFVQISFLPDFQILLRQLPSRCIYYRSYCITRE